METHVSYDATEIVECVGLEITTELMGIATPAVGAYLNRFHPNETDLQERAAFLTGLCAELAHNAFHLGQNHAETQPENTETARSIAIAAVLEADTSGQGLAEALLALRAVA